MREFNIAILFSGNGSNLENVYKALNGVCVGDMRINIALGVSSRRDAYGIRRCEKMGLKCEILASSDYKTSPLAANSPLGNLCGSEDSLSLQRTQSASHSLESSQPTNLIQEARILESNLSHSHAANAGSLESNEILEANDLQNRNENNATQSQTAKSVVGGLGDKGSDFAIQAPFPSLKVESIENPCEKDSNKNKNLESRNAELARQKYDHDLGEILRTHKIDLVVLAGFMRVLGAEFCENFTAINIHPSLLPLFKGAHAIVESYHSDMKVAGVSVHFVSSELDSGTLIAQEAINKRENESLEEFESRIHELEYQIYPKAIIKAIEQILSREAKAKEY